MQFFPAVRFVMSALVSRMEHSTIVEGQRLGTVHIMEGTFFREVYTHIHIHIHIHTRTHTFQKKTFTKTCACARLGGWLCGRVVWCGVVWCGVLMYWCPSPWYSQT